MKKISFIMALMLTVCMMIPVAQAASDVHQETEVIHTEFGDFEITTFLSDSMARSSGGASKRAEVKSGGKVVAEVTLSATFGYDGNTAWVISASGSHTTYDSWSYSGEKITKSGGTATLTATVTHTKYGSVPVKISITCSPTGQVS